jgi:predicted nucleic acid-binding protein
MPTLPSNRYRRVHSFFDELITSGNIGIVTPTIFKEFIHVAIKLHVQRELVRRGNRERQRAVHGRAFDSWIELYKAEPRLLVNFSRDLDRLRDGLTVNGLVILGTEGFPPLSRLSRFDDELIAAIGRYALDSDDALILVEAARYGINDIISLDPDMRRAEIDFNIYTWF